MRCFLTYPASALPTTGVGPVTLSPSGDFYRLCLIATAFGRRILDMVKACAPCPTISSVAEPGGAVNFVTKQPLRERHLRLTLGAGQDGYRKAGADITGSISPDENVQGRLVLAYVEPEEWRAGRPDDTYRYLVAPSVNWD